MKYLVFLLGMISSAMASHNLDSFPIVAVNGGGDMVVLWEGEEGGSTEIQAAIREQGGMWGAASPISDPNSFYGDVALNANGEILGVWQTYNGSDFQIEALASMVGEAWGSAMPIPMQAAKNMFPKVVLDQNGNGVAVWQSAISGNNSAVFASSFIDGSWALPVQLSAGSQLFARPRLAIREDTGDAIVLWQELNDLSVNIWASFLPFGGAWTDPTALSENTASALQAQVAFSSSGQACAIWSQDDAEKKTIAVHAKVRASDGTWGTEFVRSVESCDFSVPQIAINSNGLGLAAWLCKGSSSQWVEAAIYDPTLGTWGEPTALVTEQNQIKAVQLALNDSNEAVAIWNTSNAQGKLVVQAAVRSAGGTWGSATTISHTDQNNLRPCVGIDGEGRAVVAWQEDDGVSPNQIEATIFSGGSWGAPTVIGSVDFRETP